MTSSPSASTNKDAGFSTKARGCSRGTAPVESRIQRRRRHAAAVLPGDTATPMVRRAGELCGRRDRCRLSRAARTVRRRRHGSRFAQARQRSVCRRRRVGLRRRHGQRRDETIAARRKNSRSPNFSCFNAPDRNAIRFAQVKQNAGPAALRQTGQPGLVGRHQQSQQEKSIRRRRQRSFSLRQQDHHRRSHSPAARSNARCSAMKSRSRRCRARSSSSTISIPTTPSISTIKGARLEIPAQLPRRSSKKFGRPRCAPTGRCAAKEWRGWIFSCEPDGQVLVNEINTIPGFTKISMYPKMWEASGTSLSPPDRPADRPCPGKSAAREAFKNFEIAPIILLTVRTRKRTGQLWALKTVNLRRPLYQLCATATSRSSISAKGEKAISRPAISAISTCAGSTPPASISANSYFRAADLRGIDFSKTCLEGASINGARISGASSPRTECRRDRALDRARHPHALQQMRSRHVSARER